MKLGRPRAVPNSPLPLATSLEDIYTESSLPSQNKRWSQLSEHFVREYGMKPQKCARAPGRVNVMGDHIDYCGFSVLPAAIERDVLIAFATTSAALPANVKAPQPTKAGRSVIVLRNVEREKYTDTHFEVDLDSWGGDLPLPKTHHWSSYFIAGTKGILQTMHNRPAKTVKGSSTKPTHILMLVWGSVPEGSGLSSSSAMVTASASAVLEICGRREGPDFIGRRGVTETAIESERLVGVNSGGMDQAASVFSKPLHLLHIEFVPKLEASAIPIPETNPPCSFVIANTLVTSNKKLTAKFCYNLRVVECRVGALLLHQALNLPARLAHAPPLTYKMVVDTYFSTPPQPAGPLPKGTEMPTHTVPDISVKIAHPSSPLPPRGASKVHELKTMLGLAAKTLGGPGMEDGMTWEQCAERLGRDVEDLQKEVVGKQEVEPVNGKLRIWKRARHVFSDALRVYELRELLEQSSSTNATLTADDLGLNHDHDNDDSSSLLKDMGQLMNASMDSAEEDGEFSCPELSEMVRLARKSGAVGSRSTGAGWGGATVSLVPEPLVPSFIAALRQHYYANKFPNLSEQELADACFATKPEAGAGLYAF